MEYDASVCHTCQLLSEEQLEQIIPVLLKEFYERVNDYFLDGVDNFNNGYQFHFSYIMSSNSADDNDPLVGAMLQYTTNSSDIPDICYHVHGGRACKYFTNEFILPAHTYLAYKCRNLGYVFEEACDRYCGAPIICIPTKVIDPRMCEPVTQMESPKLFDSMFDVLKDITSGHTNIFSR